eukprot:1613787-Pleurochrysis_carterae.AAC.1
MIRRLALLKARDKKANGMLTKLGELSFEVMGVDCLPGIAHNCCSFREKDGSKIVCVAYDYITSRSTLTVLRTKQYVDCTRAELCVTRQAWM